jgi:hypothetical protein
MEFRSCVPRRPCPRNTWEITSGSGSGHSYCNLRDTGRVLVQGARGVGVVVCHFLNIFYVSKRTVVVERGV